MGYSPTFSLSFDQSNTFDLHALDFLEMMLHIDVNSDKFQSLLWTRRTMYDRKTSDNILNSLAELAENASKQKSISNFFEEDTSISVSSQFNRLFGREKPVHHLLGGGKCRNFLFFLLFTFTIKFGYTKFFLSLNV